MTDLSVIEDYICRIHKDAHENYPQNFDHIVELYRTDLNDIKIKLEILLPQADIKEGSQNLIFMHEIHALYVTDIFTTNFNLF